MVPRTLRARRPEAMGRGPGPVTAVMCDGVSPSPMAEEDFSSSRGNTEVTAKAGLNCRPCRGRTYLRLTGQDWTVRRAR